MSVTIITGSAGLVGSEAALYFNDNGFHIAGIDNNLRERFFGPEGSTLPNRLRLQRKLGRDYEHHDIDVRDRAAVDHVFARFGHDAALVIHTSAQPSHDWAASAPLVDFDINAVGTANVLEATRRFCPEAVFIFTSTNKVYGDRPNSLPLIEQSTRFELDPSHPCADGIDESMSVDASLHSVFGASKLAADLLVQEYGRYFGVRTACFRAGTITGPRHAGAELHGFLAYLVRCCVTGRPYTVFGYKGKQVRDAIHSRDLIRAFDEFFRAPTMAGVYNIGGGRFSNCSVLEAIEECQEVCARELDWQYEDRARVGDHIWWISDNGKFCRDHPTWKIENDVPGMMAEIYEANREMWSG